MASRIVFLPKYEDPWYEEKVVTFEWVPGMAKSQARKSKAKVSSGRRQNKTRFFLRKMRIKEP